MFNYDEMVKRVKEMSLDELKDAKFMNDMIDRWSYEDRMWDSVLWNEIMARKKAQKN